MHFRFLQKQNIEGTDGTEEPISELSDLSDSAEDDKAGSSSNAQYVKSKKTYKQKYRKGYGTQFNWLISTQNKELFCNACNIIINGGITHVKRHSNTLKHKKKLKASSRTPKIIDIFENSESAKLSTKVREADILMVLLIAEHNLPFSFLDHLGKIVKTAFPDSQIAKMMQIGRTKGTLLCKQILSNEQKTIVQNIVRDSFFSLIVDETTDVSIKASLAIVIRYFDSDCKKVRECFLGLIGVENKSAEGIFNSIITFLNSNKINIKNLVGLAADNTNVMMGDKSGLKARFKELVPNIFIFGCICHSFSLCSSAACEKLPTAVEKLARDICNYFKNSSVRLNHLKECQVFLNIKPHKILKLCQTRWLSLQSVVNRIVEQYDPLILFFTNESFKRFKEDNPDHILAALKNPIYKMYFLFLSYTLELVNNLNLEFQSNSLKLHKLLEHISTVYKTFAANFIVRHKVVKNVTEIPINNPDYYLPLENIYLGPKCEMYIVNNNIPLKDLNILRTHCLHFYVELLRQIKSRVPFDDEVLNYIKVLDPVNVYNNKFDTLIPILNRFPMLTTDFELTENEWRLLKQCEEIKIKSDEPPIQFWNHVFKIKSELNVLMFPNLKIFIYGLMALPHSSAAAERVFSQLNLIKTKTRNKLSLDSCDALLRTKELLNDHCCFEFKCNLSLLQRKINYNKEDSDDELTF